MATGRNPACRAWIAPFAALLLAGCIPNSPECPAPAPIGAPGAAAPASYASQVVVGTGAAGFAGDEGEAKAGELRGPAGINFDADGGLWIADTLNQRVRRVAGFLSTQSD